MSLVSDDASWQVTQHALTGRGSLAGEWHVASSLAGRLDAERSCSVGAMRESVCRSPRMRRRSKCVESAHMEQLISSMVAESSRRSEQLQHLSQSRDFERAWGDETVAGISGVQQLWTKRQPGVSWHGTFKHPVPVGVWTVSSATRNRETDFIS